MAAFCSVSLLVPTEYCAVHHTVPLYTVQYTTQCLSRLCSTHTVPLYPVQYTHTASLHCAIHTHHRQICCHNTDYVHINGHDKTITVILAKDCIELPDDGSLVIRNMLEQF